MFRSPATPAIPPTCPQTPSKEGQHYKIALPDASRAGWIKNPVFGPDWRKIIEVYDVVADAASDLIEKDPQPATGSSSGTQLNTLNENEPDSPGELKSSYEGVAEFPCKTQGVSYALVKGQRANTRALPDQQFKLFIQSACDVKVSSEFFAITHSQGIQMRKPILSMFVASPSKYLEFCSVSKCSALPFGTLLYPYMFTYVLLTLVLF